MKGARAFVTGVAGGLVLFASAALLGQTPAQVKEDAKALARSLAPGVKDTARSGPTPDNLPNYRAGTPSEASLYSDPDNLKARGEAAAPGDPTYQQMRQSMGSRATFQRSELDAVVSRSFAIQNDPNAVVGSYTAGSGTGGCRPLPPSTTGDLGWDETSCNAGTKVDETAPVCRVPLVVDVTPGTKKYIYTCEDWVSIPKFGGNNAARRCSPAFNTVRQNGVCRERSRQTVFYEVCLQGNPNFCTEPDMREGEEITYECDSPAVARPYVVETVGEVVNARRDESSCNAAIANQTCEAPTEVCVDPDPTTRVINGVAVTQACWQWERRYACHSFSQASDCSELSARPGCTFLREECLDEPQEGACKVSNKVYRCPVPAPPSTEQQYICDGDIYCINGECETIERTPSTEFGDAVMALNSAADTSRQLDPNSLTVFRGTRNTCSKTIFGITNCCAPRGFPIVGGGCDGDDRVLKDKRENGLCHYVGTYCSSSVLGVCTKRKESHCCYGSKLARIIQEQGRPQLGLNWGTAKKTTCDGFTVDQFSRLDLSRIDFSEVMAEFVEAARLPDQLQTANDLQTRINNYYATPRP